MGWTGHGWSQSADTLKLLLGGWEEIVVWSMGGAGRGGIDGALVIGKGKVGLSVELALLVLICWVGRGGAVILLARRRSAGSSGGVAGVGITL